MTAFLNAYIPTADALARLFAPHVEVVLHDLVNDRIHHIANCFSKRKVGDASLTDTHDVDLSTSIIGPYAKTNWDGRRLKAISTVIQDADGSPVGLMCINHDIEAFSQVFEQMLGIMSVPGPMPAAITLFAGDWREKINEHVGAFLADRSTTLSGLSSEDGNALVAALDRAGMFSIRNASNYVANVIGCSRATLYNRLKLVRLREKKHAPSDA